MLKAHQACIDLEKGVLRIQGREVSFLPEHELPAKARMSEQGLHPDIGSTSAAGETSTRQDRFPGSGNTLGTRPGGGQSSQSQLGQSRHPESAIQTLIGFGVSRDVAIATLDASDGDVEVAASLLF